MRINQLAYWNTTVDWFRHSRHSSLSRIGAKTRSRRPSRRTSEWTGSLLQQFHRCSFSMFLDASRCSLMSLDAFFGVPRCSLIFLLWCEVALERQALRNKRNMRDDKEQRKRINGCEIRRYARKFWTNYYVYTWKQSPVAKFVALDTRSYAKYTEQVKTRTKGTAVTT